MHIIRSCRLNLSRATRYFSFNFSLCSPCTYIIILVVAVYQKKGFWFFIFYFTLQFTLTTLSRRRQVPAAIIPILFILFSRRIRQITITTPSAVKTAYNIQVGLIYYIPTRALFYCRREINQKKSPLFVNKKKKKLNNNNQNNKQPVDNATYIILSPIRAFIAVCCTIG